MRTGGNNNCTSATPARMLGACYSTSSALRATKAALPPKQRRKKHS
jgi:hypothetical protein